MTDQPQTAQQFYGSAYSRGKPDKLDAALRQLNMAMKAQTEGVTERALALACKTEVEAFA